MTTALIALLSLGVWRGLAAAAFRAPPTVAAAITLLHRPGGRHAR